MEDKWKENIDYQYEDFLRIEPQILSRLVICHNHHQKNPGLFS